MAEKQVQEVQLRRCCYRNCGSNGKRKEPGLIFIPFPKPCQSYFKKLVNALVQKDKIPCCRCPKCTRCKHWIHLCRHGDGLRDVKDVNARTYICNKHFVADSGPTAQHPDPLPATLLPQQIAKRKNVRRPPKMRNCPTNSTASQRIGLDVTPATSHDNISGSRDDETNIMRTNCTNLVETMQSHGNGTDAEKQLSVSPTNSTSLQNIASEVPSATSDSGSVECAGNSVFTPTHLLMHNYCNNLMKSMEIVRVHDNGHRKDTEMQISVRHMGTQSNLCHNLLKDVATQSECIHILGTDKETQTSLQGANLENWDELMQTCQKTGWSCECQNHETVFVSMEYWNVEGVPRRMVIAKQVIVTRPFTCRVFILGRDQTNMDIGKEACQISSVPELQNLLAKLKRIMLCKGIEEKKFVQGSQQQQIAARVQFCIQTGTRRSVGCKVTTNGTRCHECLKLRMALQYHLKKCKPDPANQIRKTCNNRYMTEQQLVMKVKEYRRKLDSMKSMNARLKEKVRRIIKEGYIICEEDDTDLSTILSCSYTVDDQDKCEL